VLGSFEVGTMLNSVQIIMFLVFLTFYIPSVSTFAVILKTIGRRCAYDLARMTRYPALLKRHFPIA